MEPDQIIIYVTSPTTCATIEKVTIIKSDPIDVASVKCEQCKFVCRRASDLKRHVTARHAIKVPSLLKCNECDFTCKLTIALKRHQLSHALDTPFKCTKCAQEFDDLSELEIHQRNHMENKLCSGNDCNNASTSSSDPMQSGKVSITRKQTLTKKRSSDDLIENASVKCKPRGNKFYTCDQCSFTCKQATRIEKHLQKHRIGLVESGEEIFKCDQCSYTCNLHYSLKIHKRIHSGEKPYICGECGYGFNNSSHLRRHERIHSGDKPFTCDQCNYACSQLSNLKAHRLIHDVEKPFKCDQCDYGCTQFRYLRTHQRSHLTSPSYEDLYILPNNEQSSILPEGQTTKPYVVKINAAE